MNINPGQSSVLHSNMRRDIPIVYYVEGIYFIAKDGKRFVREKLKWKTSESEYEWDTGAE